MNAHLPSLLLSSKRKSLHRLIVTNAGKYLSHQEAVDYIRWAINHVYEYLKDVPEFETIEIK